MTGTDPNDELDEALRALAHPTRRVILRLTMDDAVPAMELAQRLGIAPATASEHLRVLRKTGLVDQTASGTQRLYRANHSHIAAVIAALGRDIQRNG